MFIEYHVRVSYVHSVLSLARQWTMEDEEEVEREKRRRVKSSSSAADADVDFSTTPGGTPSSDSTHGTDSTSEMSQGLSRLFSQFSKTEFDMYLPKFDMILLL